MKKIRLTLLAGSLLLVWPLWAAEGDWDRAKTAHERGDYATELSIIRPLAEKGYAFAQFNLGVLYDEGKGVSQDDAMALKWYQRAADQGLSQAQVNLAIMYENGQGMAPNLQRAYFWYTLADEQGDGRAIQGKREVAEKLTAAQIQETEQWLKEYRATHIFRIRANPPLESDAPHGGNR